MKTKTFDWKFVLSALIMAFVIGLMITPVMADSPIIVDPATGRYLGNLNNNTLDPNSVSNPMGRYGSTLSPDSINNRMGRYGSPLSPSSVNNPFVNTNQFSGPLGTRRR